MTDRDEHVDQWVTEAMAGDENAKTALYTHFHPYVTRVVQLHKASGEDPEDISQQVFFHAFRALPTFQRKSTFRTWITRIAMNDSLMTGRYAKTHPVVREADLDEESGDELALRHPLDKHPSPEEDIRTHELLETICRDLSADQRTALELRYLEGLSPDEISAATGRTMACTKNDLHRGLMHAHENYEHIAQRPSVAQSQPAADQNVLSAWVLNHLRETGGKVIRAERHLARAA